VKILLGLGTNSGDMDIQEQTSFFISNNSVTDGETDTLFARRVN
jgi:hypothetical protein